MSFTSVFLSVEKGEKDNAWVSNSKWQKNSKNNSEEGYKKSKQKYVCSSKETDVRAGKEEGLTHKVTQQEKHRGKTLKKTILEGLLAKGGMALYCQ
jgi:hypothetical protein